MEHPTFGNGKICYIQMPAVDIQKSAAFYSTVFGWNVRQRGDGSVSFDDGVGEVSGEWTTHRKVVADPGFMISIMVDDIEATIEKVTANGGVIVRPVGMDAPELTAHFTDPAGNCLGLYQHHRK
jgi:uncharacterized protein